MRFVCADHRSLFYDSSMALTGLKILKSNNHHKLKLISEDVETVCCNINDDESCAPEPVSDIYFQLFSILHVSIFFML